VFSQPFDQLNAHVILFSLLRDHGLSGHRLHEIISHTHSSQMPDRSLTKPQPSNCWTPSATNLEPSTLSNPSGLLRITARCVGVKPRLDRLMFLSASLNHPLRDNLVRHISLSVHRLKVNLTLYMNLISRSEWNCFRSRSNPLRSDVEASI